MAIEYYDWDTTGSTDDSWSTSTWGGSNSITDSDTTTSLDFTDSTGNASTWRFWSPPRRMYVIMPDHWSGADTLAFSKMTWDVPGFGYRVESIIKGDVLLMDPTIPVRDFSDFLPLLRITSTTAARKALAEFIAARNEPEATP